MNATVVDGVVRVECFRRLDLPLAAAIVWDVENWMEQGSKHFVLDMSAVEDVTYAAVAFLTGFARGRKAQGMAILLGLTPELKQKMGLLYSEIFEFLHLADSEQEVLFLIAQAGYVA